jgi:hypothetical protein
MPARRIAVPVALLALAAGAAATPAAASAATLNVNRACYDYMPNNAITIVGTGYTPGDTIDLQATEIFETATAGADGTFVTLAPVPVLGFITPGAQTFTLTATSEATATQLAATSFRVANFAVSTKPARARPHTKVRFSFSGFVPGRQIYGHFLLHGKLRAVKRYGRATGACGTLSTRAPLYPGRRVRFGLYRVQFDNSRKYSKTSAPRLVTTLDIFRTFHL